MLSWNRTRPHVAILLALFAVVGLSTAIVMALQGGLASAADEGVRMGLGERSGSDLALRASLPLTSDAQRQDELVRLALDETLVGLPVPLSVVRTVSAEVPLTLGGVDSDVLLLDQQELTESAGLTSGRWAGSPAEASIRADLADRLGLSIGAELVVDGVTQTLVGTWRVIDPLDPRWMGDERITVANAAAAVALAAPDWQSAENGEPRVAWTIVPDAASVTASGLDRATAGWPDFRSNLRAAGGDTEGLSVSGGLTESAGTLTAQVDRLHAVALISVLLIFAAVLVTIAELARLMATTRATEFALLWSRGRSALESGAATAIEAAAAAIAGGAVGMAIGMAFSTVGGFGAVRWPTASDALLVAAPAAVAAVAFGATGFRASRPASAEASDERGRRVVLPGVAILIGLAAALAVWQLGLYGSPFTVDADGETTVEPLALISPALVLLAGVLLLLLVLPVAASVVERTFRRAAVVPLTAARSFARRLPRLAAAIAVIAFAIGALVTASGYQSTWNAAFERTSALRAATDVHATAARGGFAAADVDRADALAGVYDAFPSLTLPAQLSDSAASLVAVEPTAFAQLALRGPDAFHAEALTSALGVEMPGPRIPEGAGSLTLTSAAEGFAIDPAISILVVDPSGLLVRVPGAVSRAEEPGPSISATFTVPESARDGSAVVVALDVDAAETGIETGAHFDPPTWTTDAGSTVFAGVAWSARIGDAMVGPIPLIGGGFDAPPGLTHARLIPSIELFTGRLTPPVAVSRALADRYDLAVGDPISFGVERAARIDATVMAVLPAVPGAETAPAVLIDITVLQIDAVLSRQSPRLPNALWIVADDSTSPTAIASTATDVREALAPGTLIRTADDPAGRRTLGATTSALWTAAALCALLALATMLAVIVTERRARVTELGVLRALGARSAEQARIRRGEWGLAIVAAVVSGLIAGAAVLALTIPMLAGAVVPDDALGLGAPLRMEPLAVTMAVGLLTLCCLAVAESAAAGVARDARALRGSVGAP